MMADRTSTDDRLLEIFLAGAADEAESAFTLLVERHGPTVLGACRQVATEREDAEDAFQMTFLALARKAGNIRNRQVLGSWLQAVACRMTTRLNAKSARRRRLMTLSEEPIAPEESQSDAERAELRISLHAELDRLPGRYRCLVVHRYLEGKSIQEVARLAGCPASTVKVQLFRVRRLLRARLQGRHLVHSH
jgi:RNA polymerase sigma factor (sigma-70 family)